MGAAPDVLAMAIAELKSERPLLNVRILGETSDQVVQLLHRREVDLALGRLTTPLQHNDFDFEPLSREAMRLVVRAGHPLARRNIARARCADLVAMDPATDHQSGARPVRRRTRARGTRLAVQRGRMRVDLRHAATAAELATPSRCCRSPSCATICARSC